MKLCVISIVALSLLAGCSGALGGAATAPQGARCRSLDDSSALWNSSSVLGAGLAASGAGLSTIPGESTTARIGFAVGAVVAGAAAAAAGYYGHERAREYVQEGCGGATLITVPAGAPSPASSTTH